MVSTKNQAVNPDELEYVRKCCIQARKDYNAKIDQVRDDYEAAMKRVREGQKLSDNDEDYTPQKREAILKHLQERQDYILKALKVNHDEVGKLLNSLQHNSQTSDAQKLENFQKLFKEFFSKPRYLEPIGDRLMVAVERNALFELHQLCGNLKEDYAKQMQGNPQLDALCNAIDRMDASLTKPESHPQNRVIDFQKLYQDKEIQNLLNNPTGQSFIKKVGHLLETFFKEGISSAYGEWQETAKIEKITQQFKAQVKEIKEELESTKVNEVHPSLK